MFQDIIPHKLNIAHQNLKAGEQDFVIVCSDNKILVSHSGEPAIPTVSEIVQHYNMDAESLTGLFEIDGKGFFLAPGKLPEKDNFRYQNIREFTTDQPAWIGFGAATAVHLAHWYENNKFCGRCAAPMVPKEDERALCCPVCGYISYPRINPVVMVGITDGDKLLLTKYAFAEYRNYSLVAGFIEIGEAFEDAVRREVMEEVGLKVKNIRYYKSQPWPFSESLLAGFFADVDGDTEPYLDGKELSEAVWFHRDEIPAGNSTFSLTWDMIEHFRNMHK